MTDRSTPDDYAEWLDDLRLAFFGPGCQSCEWEGEDCANCDLYREEQNEPSRASE